MRIENTINTNLKKGGTAAFTMRLPLKQVKTVALETGIQNVGVAFLIIYTNLIPPMSDYAAFPIIAIAFMTPAPLYLVYFISRCVVLVRKRRGGGGEDDGDGSPKKGVTSEKQQEKQQTPEQVPMIEKSSSGQQQHKQQQQALSFNNKHHSTATIYYI